MGLYSVYNYATKAYDYYEAHEARPTHASAPMIVSMGGVGVSPEDAAWTLPPGSRKVGSGEFPRGRIASLGGIASSSTGKIALLGLAAVLAWRYLR
jgi:hypothetical protein